MSIDSDGGGTMYGYCSSVLFCTHMLLDRCILGSVLGRWIYPLGGIILRIVWDLQVIENGSLVLG